MKRSIKPIAALLTFSIGVALSLTDFYPIVLFSPVALFFLFHALLLGVVIHQLIVRKDNRRQVVGKGILAVIVWLVPSLMTFFISSEYMWGFLHDEVGSDRSLFALVVIAATSVVYGLAGWGLCRWVKNPRNEVLGFWERGSRSNY
jgi:hypothetical protein